MEFVVYEAKGAVGTITISREKTVVRTMVNGRGLPSLYRKGVDGTKKQ